MPAMAAKLDVQVLNLVFQSRPDLVAGIQQAADTPARIDLFNQIANFVYERVSSSSNEIQDGPASKRRRVDIDQSTPAQTQSNGHAASSGTVSTGNAASEQVLLEVKDISVAAPQRKKYSICFTQNFLYASASGSPVEGIIYQWKDIEHVLYLPVPEKSQVQHNYIIFPRDSYLPTTKAAATSSTPEPLVFTVPATAPKPGSITGPSSSNAEAVSDSFSTLFHWALTTSLRSAGNQTSIITSDPKLFHSVARQSYRPTEKAVHVKAFRGSKDGYLFFLPTGILWGFKKPILFLPLDRIVALSYTSVLQRTFNIVVELDVNEGEGYEKEIEFGMLDQEDYGGIDENYVRRHGLADRSMAEQRKAKRQLAENGKKGAGAGAGAGADGEGETNGDAETKEDNGGMTELEKAQFEEEQRLQDEEDELEEDYDPGSDDNSDGSVGSSGEDDDDDDQDGEGDDDDDGEDDEEDDGEGEGMDED
ncbi:putative chaperone protein [Cladorrhinum sp. PSN259]|nr:putative chaperone protein [Cladorrhinum sp. PSN259]